MTKKLRNRAHNRAVRKFYTKRSPCVAILIANLSLAVILSISIYFLTREFVKKYELQRYFDVQDQVIKDHYENTIAINMCPYEATNSSGFDYRMCELFCGPNAFIYRKTSLKSDRQIWTRLGYALDHACVNKYEMFSCHDSLIKHHNDGCLQGNRLIPACMGFNRFNPTSAVDFPENVLAPAVDGNVLKTAMNTIVLANQLIVKCPHCQRLTKSFRFDENSTDCYVKLGTEAHGWPAHFEFCENVGYVGECEESDPWLHLPST